METEFRQGAVVGSVFEILARLIKLTVITQIVNFTGPAPQFPGQYRYTSWSVINHVTSEVCHWSVLVEDLFENGLVYQYLLNKIRASKCQCFLCYNVPHWVCEQHLALSMSSSGAEAQKKDTVMLLWLRYCHGNKLSLVWLRSPASLCVYEVVRYLVSMQSAWDLKSFHGSWHHICHNSLIYPSFNGHLGFFLFGVFINTSAIDT